MDGNDLIAVMEAVGRAVEHTRGGNGPVLLECKTFRVRGHSEADKADYVPKELREEWLKKDPITRFEAYLTGQGILTDEEKAKVAARVKATVDDAVSFAEQSPAPDPATVAGYVFAPDGPIAVIGEPDAQNPRYINALDTRTGKPFTTMAQPGEPAYRALEEVAKR